MSIKEYLIYKSFLSLTTSHDFGSSVLGPRSQTPGLGSQVFILDYAKVN